MPSENFRNYCIEISNKLSRKALKSFRKYLQNNKCDEIPGIASVFLEDFRQILYQVFAYNLPEGLLDEKVPLDPIYGRSNSLPDNMLDEKDAIREENYEDEKSDVMENSITLPAYANASTVLAVARSKKIKHLPHDTSLRKSSSLNNRKQSCDSQLSRSETNTGRKKKGFFSIRGSLDALRRRRFLKARPELDTCEISTGQNIDSSVLENHFGTIESLSNHAALPPPPYLEAECIKYGLLHTWIGYNQFFQLFSSGLNSLKRRLETVESLNLQWIRCKLVLYRCSAGYILQVFIPPKDSKPNYGLFCGHITTIAPVDPSVLNNEPRDNVFLIKVSFRHAL
ncbi:SH2B adaptor protein [Cichlidogyrus casuarinus]|uniref:SH2B adaptor protein n=1 Tax=Cichlidogyrus casuarinus TaxID=1844966 RepID=A0ABD2PKI9_9PLAT